MNKKQSQFYGAGTFVTDLGIRVFISFIHDQFVFIWSAV